MTTLAITAHTSSPDRLLVRELAHVTGRSVVDIHRALVANGLLFEANLLQNDHEELDARLRRIVAVLSAHDIPGNCYILDKNEHFSATNPGPDAEPLASAIQVLDEIQREIGVIKRIDSARSHDT